MAENSCQDCKIYYRFVLYAALFGKKLEFVRVHRYKTDMNYEIETKISTLDYKEWLSHEFTQRCRKNPKYSIRAFAQLLKMDSSSVSQLLSGKRQASPKMIEKLANILGASPSEKEAMLGFIKSKKGKIDKTIGVDLYKQLTLDSYALIADWYHYAILELTCVGDFQNNNRWIANKLGITSAEVKIAIERLKRLDLLLEKDGKLIKTEAFITNFSQGVTSSALKGLQRKVLQMGFEAIDSISQDEKDITSMTLAIVPEKLPEAKEKIKKFRREISEFLETGKQKRVYQLGIQLYPISKK